MTFSKGDFVTVRGKVLCATDHSIHVDFGKNLTGWFKPWECELAVPALQIGDKVKVGSVDGVGEILAIHGDCYWVLREMTTQPFTYRAGELTLIERGDS